MVAVTVVPGGMLPSAHVTVAPSVQEPPVEVALVTVRPAGRTSVRDAFVAVLGPAFVTAAV
jgi:hypothetical protein